MTVFAKFKLLVHIQFYIFAVRVATFQTNICYVDTALACTVLNFFFSTEKRINGFLRLRVK